MRVHVQKTHKNYDRSRLVCALLLGCVLRIMGYGLLAASYEP